MREFSPLQNGEPCRRQKAPADVRKPALCDMLESFVRSINPAGAHVAPCWLDIYLCLSRATVWFSGNVKKCQDFWFHDEAKRGTASILRCTPRLSFREVERQNYVTTFLDYVQSKSEGRAGAFGHEKLSPLLLTIFRRVYNCIRNRETALRNALRT
jgi:hypothetical protein